MKKVYKNNKFRVEQVIGIVKNVFGNRDRLLDFHVASLCVLGKFVLYDLVFLLRLLLL